MQDFTAIWFPMEYFTDPLLEFQLLPKMESEKSVKSLKFKRNSKALL